jgi:glycosyltransferase involved in cell wall biosynthesis
VYIFFSSGTIHHPEELKLFNSPFTNSQPNNISEETQVVFVADAFLEHYQGGAEFTTEALIEKCPYRFEKILAKDVSLEVLESGHHAFWIFGNFSSLNLELVPTIVANMNYSILEYDYKYCKYRSAEKHKNAEDKECDCHEDIHGKIVSAFYYGAQSLWWMSEKQEKKYQDLFPFLAEKQSTVLSSVFNDDFFVALKVLREENKDIERKGWIVLGSNSWIKGKDAAEKHCKENGLEYEVVWDLPYKEVLEKLAKAKGFVYLPEGGDTCPRMVIEAKLLGCELVLNDLVEHKNEIWFDTETMFDTEAYLYAARDRFWNGITANMNYMPTVSGYTTTKDCISQEYPWKQCIESMLGFCAEVVVVDGGSIDGTWEELIKWSEKEERLKVDQITRDWSHKRHAVFDGVQKAAARSRCTSDFLWQMDADEVVHEEDYGKIVSLCKHFPKELDLMCLPVIEYWGGPEKIRADINPWKWRLSRNVPHITHGIPVELRNYDDDGELHALPGTDGCDYVHHETFQRVPHATFYTKDIDDAKTAALSGNKEAFVDYQRWFQSLVDTLPGVHHYSWFDIERKIKTYKNYWQKHWESLYDIHQEDTSENNMFFQKPWSEVSDEEIKNLASRLSKEIGGWVFHSPVDFSNPNPHLVIKQGQPKVMLQEDGD